MDFYDDGTFDYIINGDRNTGTWAYDRSNTEKYIYSFTPGTIAILMEMSLTGDPKLQEWIDTAVEFYPTPDSSPFYACYYALCFFKLTMGDKVVEAVILHPSNNEATNICVEYNGVVFWEKAD